MIVLKNYFLKISLKIPSNEYELVPCSPYFIPEKYCYRYKSQL